MQVIRKFGQKIVAGAIALVCLVTLAAALDPVAIPELQLTSIDNASIKTSDLPSKGNWVLIYVQPKSQFSDNLLRLLKREQYPSLEQHAIIVVGGTLDDLKVLKAKYAELDKATWYADTTKSAFTLLKLHGVPVILGVKDQIIQWSLNGVLSDVNVAKSIVNTWVQQ